jgi:hypothetical protein
MIGYLARKSLLRAGPDRKKNVADAPREAKFSSAGRD